MIAGDSDGGMHQMVYDESDLFQTVIPMVFRDDWANLRRRTYSFLEACEEFDTKHGTPTMAIALRLFTEQQEIAMKQAERKEVQHGQSQE